MESILDLKWKEIEKLDKQKTVLFLTVAPIEEHGLHLPVSVDIDLGEHWKKAVVQKLKKKHRDCRFLSLPFLPLAQGSMKTFPGCIYLGAKLLRRVMTGYLASIAEWGIKYLVVIASHGDPLHNMAIEKACTGTNRKYGTSFISPLGSMFSYKELKIDLRFPAELQDMLNKHPDDFHAGWIETSMMLDIHPEKVDESYKTAEDVTISEKDMIKPKVYINATAGKGHLGCPRLAGKSLGRMLNESTAEYIASVTEKLINEKDVSRYSHHFLNRIPFLRILV